MEREYKVTLEELEKLLEKRIEELRCKEAEARAKGDDLATEIAYERSCELIRIVDEILH